MYEYIPLDNVIETVDNSKLKSPFISILLATRGNFNGLEESINSLVSLATDSHWLEFILKIDDDDLETKTMVEKLSTYIPIKTLCSPKRNGYYDLKDWLNEMAKMASGKFLFIWNDNAQMITKNWEQYFIQYSYYREKNNDAFSTDIYGFSCPVDGVENSTEFIVFPRKLYEILGHITNTCFIDTYLATILKMLSAFWYSPIKVMHSKNKRNVDFNYSVACYNTLMSVESLRSRTKDLNILIDYIELFYENEKSMGSIKI